ncbi:MAG: hypothetical protein D6757_03470 [Alphaproteobacteria bacterium]|nr:MAG: hypothetical protein D6757_03470 [Alphaproteobacteria bacterium]
MPMRGRISTGLAILLLPVLLCWFASAAVSAGGQEGGGQEQEADVARLERAISLAREQRQHLEELVAAAPSADDDSRAHAEGDKAEKRALLEKVLPPAAFTRRVEASGNDGEFLIVERFDPIRPPGRRWQTIERRPADEPEGKNPEHHGADGTFAMYAWMVSALSADGARFLGRDAAGRPRWRLARVPSVLLGEKMRRFAGRLTAEAVVDGPDEGPYLAELRLAIDKPFRARGIAKVKQFESRFTFAPLAGRGAIMVPKEVETRIELSILLLGTERGHTRILYDDYVPRETVFEGTGDPRAGDAEK